MKNKGKSEDLTKKDLKKIRPEVYRFCVNKKGTNKKGSIFN